MSTHIILLLYFVGLALIATEAFMPGLILGLMGLAAIVVSVVNGLKVSVWFGLAQVSIAVVFIPAVIYWGFRNLALKRTLGATEGVVSFGESEEALVGRIGKAVTPLRPAGTAEFGDKKYDVVADGFMVEPGATIQVIKVEGNRIVVKTV